MADDFHRALVKIAWKFAVLSSIARNSHFLVGLILFDIAMFYIL